MYKVGYLWFRVRWFSVGFLLDLCNWPFLFFFLEWKCIVFSGFDRKVEKKSSFGSKVGKKVSFDRKVGKRSRFLSQSGKKSYFCDFQLGLLVSLGVLMNLFILYVVKENHRNHWDWYVYYLLLLVS